MGLLIAVGALALLAGQLIAGAAVLEVVGGLPRWQGIVIGGMAMTVYFTAGGLLSSAWVNALQLVVLLGGFLVAAPLILMKVGGLEGIAAAPGIPSTYWDPMLRRGVIGLDAADPADAWVHHLAGPRPEGVRRD